MKTSELIFLLNKTLHQNGDNDVYVRVGENEFSNIFDVVTADGEMDGKMIQFNFLSLHSYGNNDEDILFN